MVNMRGLVHQAIGGPSEMIVTDQRHVSQRRAPVSRRCAAARMPLRLGVGIFCSLDVAKDRGGSLTSEPLFADEQGEAPACGADSTLELSRAAGEPIWAALRLAAKAVCPPVSPLDVFVTAHLHGGRRCQATS
jgi:hypothetical protein